MSMVCDAYMDMPEDATWILFYLFIFLELWVFNQQNIMRWCRSYWIMHNPVSLSEELWNNPSWVRFTKPHFQNWCNNDLFLHFFPPSFLFSTPTRSLWKVEVGYISHSSSALTFSSGPSDVCWCWCFHLHPRQISIRSIWLDLFIGRRWTC